LKSESPHNGFLLCTPGCAALERANAPLTEYSRPVVSRTGCRLRLSFLLT
jgi:hypothetical protein